MPNNSMAYRAQKTVPVPRLGTGIGLRAAHFTDVLETKPDIGFLEIHSENFFHCQGIGFETLQDTAKHYPISMHGVGLSLGSADGISTEHLQKLKNLNDAINPILISEHLSWSQFQGQAFPDLLPLPMTKEALDLFADHVNQTQDFLGRQILIENPSAYLSYDFNDIEEPLFLRQLVERTHCGLLLDINNIHVSCHNMKQSAQKYLDAFPFEAVQEIHLAGYQINHVDGHDIFIDAHNHPVYPAVWKLYETCLSMMGDCNTLIEWDNDLPPLTDLVAEAHKADQYREVQKSQVQHA